MMRPDKAAPAKKDPIPMSIISQIWRLTPVDESWEFDGHGLSERGSVDNSESLREEISLKMTVEDEEVKVSDGISLEVTFGDGWGSLSYKGYK